MGRGKSRRRKKGGHRPNVTPLFPAAQPPSHVQATRSSRPRIYDVPLRSHSPHQQVRPAHNSLSSPLSPSQQTAKFAKSFSQGRVMSSHHQRLVFCRCEQDQCWRFLSGEVAKEVPSIRTPSWVLMASVPFFSEKQGTTGRNGCFRDFRRLGKENRREGPYNCVWRRSFKDLAIGKTCHLQEDLTLGHAFGQCEDADFSPWSFSGLAGACQFSIGYQYLGPGSNYLLLNVLLMRVPVVIWSLLLSTVLRLARFWRTGGLSRWWHGKPWKLHLLGVAARIVSGAPWKDSGLGLLEVLCAREVLRGGLSYYRFLTLRLSGLSFGRPFSETPLRFFSRDTAEWSASSVKRHNKPSI